MTTLERGALAGLFAGVAIMTLGGIATATFHPPSGDLFGLAIAGLLLLFALHFLTTGGQRDG